jgi:hypothetical protein
MGLVHEDDVDWFLTLDETHHEFSTVGARGGAAAGRYVNPSFPRSGERCIVSSFHTTGVYGTTLRGEPLIPLYILSTKSIREEDYKIDSHVCEGLPTVVAAYGADEESCYSSVICVRQKGSMDTGLWHQLVRDVYTPCFNERISPEPIRDPLTKKLISGPLIIKTDAGPGRLSKEASSIEFRDHMATKGVHILLSLPNATASTAEMDKFFEKFKPACGKSALRLAAKKMQMRMEVRMEVQNNNADAVIDVDASDASSSEDEDEPNERKKKGGQSICNVSFSNFDLANLVNGWPDDPVELRPFDYHFTKEGIIGSWLAVGFLPMTGKAAEDPKVRHELGEGGAPPAAARRLAALNKEYIISATTLTAMGFNGELLDCELPKVKKQPVFRDEEAQIQHIVDNKLLNKAGGLYKTGLIVANCRVVLEAGKRMAELEKKAKEKVELKKNLESNKRGCEARKAHADWVLAGSPVDVSGHPRLNKKDSLALVKFLLPKVDILGELKLKDFNSMKKCNVWLGEIGRGMTWDEHMLAAAQNIREQWRAEGEILGEDLRLDGPPMFEVGGV